ncbi:MAG: hypothetical protein A2X49_15230 [Lentisphaerae bacterium GWF2_52_8]|nr:MAG: hypothetical protein A2X49_15230 [Lentisphaerae bacterium GWF2_52_8]
MKKLFLLYFCVLALGSAVSARDLTSTDGKTYKNVQITQITPLGIFFLCNGQSGWLDFKDLSPDVQHEFGYDPGKAQDFEKGLSGNSDAAFPSGANANYDASSFPPEAQPLPDGQVPPQGSTIVNVNDETPASYNDIVCGGPSYCSGYYVYWNNRYYPYYYWHHWYWHNHWVYHNGRYYPWDYYHHHGVWHNGQYYPYHHGALQNSEPWKKIDAAHGHVSESLSHRDEPAKANEKRELARREFERQQAEIREAAEKRGINRLPATEKKETAPVAREHGGEERGGGGGGRR